jgi:uncharacterized protein YjbI with pentapeptide repeats
MADEQTAGSEQPLNLEDFILNAKPLDEASELEQQEHDDTESKIGHIHASLPVKVQTREELDALLPNHYAWMESVLNPSKKIIAGRMNISGSDLSGWDLRGINLAGASLVGCQCVGTIFAKANLTGCDLRRSDLSGANLEGAKLRRTQLEGAVFTDAELKDCDMRGAHGFSA